MFLISELQTNPSIQYDRISGCCKKFFYLNKPHFGGDIYGYVDFHQLLPNFFICQFLMPSYSALGSLSSLGSSPPAIALVGPPTTLVQVLPAPKKANETGC
jgi:hypothetical protein